MASGTPEDKAVCPGVVPQHVGVSIRVVSTGDGNRDDCRAANFAQSEPDRFMVGYLIAAGDTRQKAPATRRRKRTSTQGWGDSIALALQRNLHGLLCQG